MTKKDNGEEKKLLCLVSITLSFKLFVWIDRCWCFTGTWKESLAKLAFS